MKTLTQKQQLSYELQNMKSIFDKGQVIERIKKEIARFPTGL